MNYTYTYTYTLISNSTAVQRSDGAIIPADPGNTDYRAYLAWVAGGNSASPAPVPTPQPNGPGFISAVKAALGGVLAANTLATLYPLFFPALQQGDWADVQAIIEAANTAGHLTSTQYAAVKSATVANNIPVTLP